MVSEGERREFREYTSTHAGSEEEQMSSDIAEQAVLKTSAYVSMRQHTSEEERMRSDITEQTLQKRQADAEPEADKQVLTYADVC